MGNSEATKEDLQSDGGWDCTGTQMRVRVRPKIPIHQLTTDMVEEDVMDNDADTSLCTGCLAERGVNMARDTYQKWKFERLIRREFVCSLIHSIFLRDYCYAFKREWVDCLANGTIYDATAWTQWAACDVG